MKRDEDVSVMFNQLNDIVNEFKGLGFNVSDEDFSHKFLRRNMKQLLPCL